MTDRIRIKQYEQAADEKVSIGGIKWLRKWDVCIQCDSAEEAEALRARLAQPEQPNYSKAGFGKTKREECCAGCGKQASEGWALYCVKCNEREWQGLTDNEYEMMAENYVTNYYFDTLKFARAIEAALKSKNG